MHGLQTNGAVVLLYRPLKKFTAGLAGNGETEAEWRRRAGLAALDRLATLTADLPSVDAVQVAREIREELEQRPHL